MIGPDRIPEGFAVRSSGRSALVAERGLLDALADTGLDRPSGWERAGEAVAGAGRGAARVWAAPGGRTLLLKWLRRGGLAGPWWRDRHLGVSRLIANLALPAAARLRGIPTPPAAALLVERGPGPLWRGWLAVEALEGEDLLARLRRDPAAAAPAARAALAAVRRAHDAGLAHPDLNLGNLFVDRAGAAWILDLDGARLRSGPLDTGRRFRELLRLERSWRRRVGPRGPGGEALEDWFEEAYASGDDDVRRSLRRRRPAGRFLLALRGAGRGKEAR